MLRDVLTMRGYKPLVFDHTTPEHRGLVALVDRLCIQRGVRLDLNGRIFIADRMLLAARAAVEKMKGARGPKAPVTPQTLVGLPLELTVETWERLVEAVDFDPGLAPVAALIDAALEDLKGGR